MPPYNIFYSWQSDLPNATNRGFILKALEGAASAIASDETVKVEPVVDRDTAGIPGSPDISATIFEKISQTQIFVCDVSIINQGTEGRPMPNPNVLIELGYAMSTLGVERIIMVMNTAFGGPDQLPFDLRMRRVIPYDMPQEAKDRAPERRTIEKIFRAALESVIEQQAALSGVLVQQPRLSEQAISAIEENKPNQKALVRRFMHWVSAEVSRQNPSLRGGGADDELVRAIDESLGLAIEFSAVAETIAVMDAEDAAREMYKEFSALLQGYYLPRGFSGQFNESDFDFYKFLGHELFVTLFAFLIRESRWSLIAELLDEDIYVENRSGGGSGNVSFEYVSEFLKLLQIRSKRLKLSRICLHSDILHQRHTETELAEHVPFSIFSEADFFLYLRSELQTEEMNYWVKWRPWSVVHLHAKVPRLLTEAERLRNAERLLQPLGIADIETFRTRFSERAPRLRELFRGGFWQGPLSDYNPQSFGSR